PTSPLFPYTTLFRSHLAVDLLAQDAIRAAHVVGALGRDRRRLDRQARLADSRRGSAHDLVLRAAPVLQRQVVALELDLHLGDIRDRKSTRLNSSHVS